MFKLASHIVAHGALHPGDAVGWVVRLCLSLEVIHGVRASHGRISAKAVQMLGPSCHAAGFFLDGVDCTDDILYQSPERLGGEAACPEDDTWGLGVVLYHALTGAMPFAGQDAAELRARILWSRPKPLATFGLENACLQRVVDHVLASDPAGRIQTVTVLRARLVQCHPPAAKLTALKLGKPDLRALSDETDDSQGVKLTGVIARDEIERQIREVIARRKAARAGFDIDPTPGPADPWSESDTTRRRSRDVAARVRAMNADPPTMVRTGSVVRSVAGLAVDSRPMAAAMRRAPYGEPAPDGSVSGSHARPHSAPLDASAAASPVPPSGLGIDPDATLQRSDGSRLGSAVAMRAGSGVRLTPSTSTEHEPFISVDTDDDADETMRGEIGLSWEDMPESGVPASARVSTVGLGPVRPQVIAARVEAPHAALLAEDSVAIPDMRPRWPRLVAGVLLVVLGGVVGYVLVGGSGESTDPSLATFPGVEAGATADPVLSSAGAQGDSSTGAAGPGVTASTAEPNAPAARPAGDTSACVASLFPKNAIKAGAPEFDFVCGERDVHQGATEIRVALVRSRRQRGALAAMRELDELGWYQLALFAVARAACCERPPPLETRVVKHSCPLDDRLEKVGRAATSADSQALQEALEGFVQATKCLARQGAAAAFGEMRPPSSGAAVLLRKMIARRQAEGSR